MNLIELKEVLIRTFLVKIDAIADEKLLREILDLLDSIKQVDGAGTDNDEHYEEVKKKFASVLHKVS